jgi:crotonobetainyl-CoA hydratase
MTKPVIAAVNGIAMGGGFEIVLASDIVIAADHARFALPEPRIGLEALAGGLQRLPRLIGLNRAMGMLLTGRQVTATEGAQFGFVNEVASGDLMERAYSWANEIVACSPLAIRATKHAVLASYCPQLEADCTAMWESAPMQAMLNSNDAVEGPRAFVERRNPVWTNS